MQNLTQFSCKHVNHKIKLQLNVSIFWSPMSLCCVHSTVIDSMSLWPMSRINCSCCTRWLVICIWLSPYGNSLTVYVGTGATVSAFRCSASAFSSSSFLCVFRWQCSASERRKLLPHVSHLCGFSPLWIITCSRKWPLWENARLQNWQTYGWNILQMEWRVELRFDFISPTFSPEWTRLCFWKLLKWIKLFLHTWHS